MSRKRMQIMLRLALLIALEVVLSRWLSFNAAQYKIGFAFVPLAIAGVLYGPLGGMAVGGVADLLGATLFPSGLFHPGFTLSTVLRGLMFGLCLKGSGIESSKRIAFAVCFNAVVFSLGLNTFWIHQIYGTPYLVLLGGRAIQELILVPVQFIVLRQLGRGKLRKFLMARAVFE